MKVRHRLLAASVVIAVVAVTGPASQADETRTASGIVTRADGASPEGVVVTSRCSEEFFLDGPSFTATAAADGSYTVTLPDPSLCENGSATVDFRDPTGTYASEWYHGVVAGDPGDTALAPAVLSRLAGAIGGRVFDSYGHPMRDPAILVEAWCCDAEALPLPPAHLASDGSYLVRGVDPDAGLYTVFASGKEHYAGANCCADDRVRPTIRVAPGETTRLPRLILKDLPRFRTATAWRARSVTVRVRVASQVTGHPAGGRIGFKPYQGRECRSCAWRVVTLDHGWAVATLRLAKPHRRADMVLIDYHGSKHVIGKRFARR